jgi:hypothetical protein
VAVQPESSSRPMDISVNASLGHVAASDSIEFPSVGCGNWPGRRVSEIDQLLSQRGKMGGSSTIKERGDVGALMSCLGSDICGSRSTGERDPLVRLFFLPLRRCGVRLRLFVLRPGRVLSLLGSSLGKAVLYIVVGCLTGF